MALTARASNTVRNKNLGMVVLCFVFMCWFAYDGLVGWPARNDRVVEAMKGMTHAQPPILDTRFEMELNQWKGWNNEGPEAREKMNDIATEASHLGRMETWKSPLDLAVQRWIVVGLGLATAGAIWWLMHCQQRRVIADETTVSPSRGVVIPWEKIKVVDNTRWKRSGIVDITYVDEKGEEQKAKFDDYETDREPLIEILDLMGAKALGAEFLPKEEAGEKTGV